jgi:hypothetical protein
MPVISALGWLRQEGHEFQCRLGYIARPCLKRKRKLSGHRWENNFLFEQCILCAATSVCLLSLLYWMLDKVLKGMVMF